MFFSFLYQFEIFNFESRAPAKFSLVRSLAHILTQNGAKDHPPMSNRPDDFFPEHRPEQTQKLKSGRKVKNSR